MIGEKIKLLREKKGFTQKEIAEHLNISQSTYARIETGESNSWASYLERLCSLFEVSPSELFNTDTFILNQRNGRDSHNGYIINQLSEKLIDQYEARIAQCEGVIAEKDAALNKQESMINELREQLKKESRVP